MVSQGRPGWKEKTGVFFFVPGIFGTTSTTTTTKNFLAQNNRSGKTNSALPQMAKRASSSLLVLLLLLNSQFGKHTQEALSSVSFLFFFRIRFPSFFFPFFFCLKSFKLCLTSFVH